jgi:hypothetical protein
MIGQIMRKEDKLERKKTLGIQQNQVDIMSEKLNKSTK